MLFKYKVVNEQGATKVGEIEAVGRDVAISSLQRRGFIVIAVEETKEKNFMNMSFSLFDKVPLKDVVIMSRQISTLFDAQVSAVKTFQLMSTNVENKALAETMMAVTQDIQGGITISEAMRKHPEVFSDFYVNMIASGEESGRLKDTFLFLADYLDRQFELTSKTKNALVYPAFVIFTFLAVMVLMMTMVIPKLGAIIVESGAEIPFFTKIILGMSDFLTSYGIFLLIAIVSFVLYAMTMLKQQKNKYRMDELKLKLPWFGDLFNKLYLSRMADNMHTMLVSGIPVVRTLEITASVVGNKVYEDIIVNSVEAVKAGKMISEALAEYPEMPTIMVQMIRVGEETGSLAKILKTLGKFYQREVDNAVDTVIGLIEPIMIVSLAIAVGILLTGVLMPIYNVAGGIS